MNAECIDQSHDDYITEKNDITKRVLRTDQESCNQRGNLLEISLKN